VDNFTGGTTSWLLCDDRSRYLDDLWFTGIYTVQIDILEAEALPSPKLRGRRESQLED